MDIKMNFNPYTGEKLNEICPNCWVKHKPYNCGYEKCPGLKLLALEMKRKMVIYLLQIQVGTQSKRETFYITDLKGTLSKNLKDGLIITDYDTASRIGGMTENLFEEGQDGITASCDILKTTLTKYFESIKG